jgi:anti-sigma regulatory factor (Ser/Thr protein kinase)
VVERTSRLQIVPHGASLGRVRAWLDRKLASLPADLRTRVKLLANELVANSIRHGETRSDGRLTLSLTPGHGRLRVRVYDSGPGFAPESAPRGMGLYLLDKASSGWGVARLRGRFCTWFDVALPS